MLIKFKGKDQIHRRSTTPNLDRILSARLIRNLLMSNLCNRTQILIENRSTINSARQKLSQGKQPQIMWGILMPANFWKPTWMSTYRRMPMWCASLVSTASSRSKSCCSLSTSRSSKVIMLRILSNLATANRNLSGTWTTRNDSWGWTSSLLARTCQLMRCSSRTHQAWISLVLPHKAMVRLIWMVFTTKEDLQRKLQKLQAPSSEALRTKTMMTTVHFRKPTSRLRRNSRQASVILMGRAHTRTSLATKVLKPITRVRRTKNSE